MTELDFDELDRAVNDLMQDVDTTKRPSGLDDPEEKIVKLDSSPATSSPSTQIAEESVQGVTASASTVPPAIKRRGQFMDMIHPSSDMKKAATPGVKREGITIQPSPTQPHEDMVASPAPTENGTTSEAEPNDEQPPVIESGNSLLETPTDSTDEVGYPDPMEFTGKDEATDHTSDSSIEEAESTTQNDPVVDTSDQHQDMPVDDEPLSSPFLPDAKVEKRPLGSQDISTVSTEVEGDSAPPVILPAELGTEVLAIESTGGTHSEIESEAEQDISPSPEPVMDTPAASDTTQTGSIAQQYAEKPSTSATSTGAIYDTDTYHQPLDHTPKKRSILGIVIWMLSLILIGAAAAAAYFYFAPR
ncbi:hypothetical protein IPP24_00510 [Candidatus Saccharibacteria bacterium]|nr:MAG: hypothetical protein IPP24_00510 [Candidatus Saccharibacteria bacterium]